MGLKLYYGGYGEYKVFAVAESEQKAVEVIGRKINAPFLPVAAECISEVDGYEIFAGTPQEGEEQGETKPETEGDKPLRHCKNCDFTCETQGELMRHYRECHPKEG